MPGPSTSVILAYQAANDAAIANAGYRKHQSLSMALDYIEAIEQLLVVLPAMSRHGLEEEMRFDKPTLNKALERAERFVKDKRAYASSQIQVTEFCRE